MKENPRPPKAEIKSLATCRETLPCREPAKRTLPDSTEKSKKPLFCGTLKFTIKHLLEKIRGGFRYIFMKVKTCLRFLLQLFYFFILFVVIYFLIFYNDFYFNLLLILIHVAN